MSKTYEPSWKSIARQGALVLAIGLLAGLVASCSVTPTSTRAATQGEGKAAAGCKADADCVPDSCCHAMGCVPKAQAPKCDGIACTTDCVADTLDCGGKCICNPGTSKCETRNLYDGSDIK